MTYELTPTHREIGDLELLLNGAYQPLTGFLGEGDVASIEERGRLADGTPWPAPVTLTVPAGVSGDQLVLTDPEGTPLAEMKVRERWNRDARSYAGGPVQPLRPAEHGPFRRLRRPPSDVRAALGAGSVLAVVADQPLHHRELTQLRLAAEELDARVIVLAAGVEQQSEMLVRALLAETNDLPRDALVVAVPLASHGDPERDLLLTAHVARAHGATHLLAGGTVAPSPLPFVPVPEVACDDRDDTWRRADLVPESHRRTDPPIAELLDSGEPIPRWFTPEAVARELRRARPPLAERGLTVFLTGLSGSGKSTIARGLYDALVERGDRTVTLLDGDIVRRLLSAGLTFSRADRDLNIRRIGYVAAEVSRHGGLAICAPIAPYAATRAEVRRMVDAVGDFVLIYVATPLEECERRDRKGLYAKARAGQIKEFTGISDPYEEPDDADLVVDTTHLAPSDAVTKVLELLVARGWLRDSGRADLPER